MQMLKYNKFGDNVEKPFMKITIAGASGFIGKTLINSVSSHHQVRGLSRVKHEAKNNVEWVAADLFSYQSTLEALVDTEIAVYLVHSMIPTARLFQGNFQDTDLLLADNFARVCAKNGVKQIIWADWIPQEKRVNIYRVESKSKKYLKLRVSPQQFCEQGWL